ncbi:MAG: hypothetical protein ACI4WM_02490 [Erysipelotrichaceae bacterium]
MKEKSTQELNEILNKTHISNFSQYEIDNKQSLIEEKEGFYIYFRKLLNEKNLTQQTVFLKADIPERYGYKLLSGEKTTRQRDIILRLCYAGNLTLEETQAALKKYGMMELYSRVKRDALLMLIFKERPGSIIDVNETLKNNGLEPLRTSGVQEYEPKKNSSS